jgi:hypothetical protein
VEVEEVLYCHSQQKALAKFHFIVSLKEWELWILTLISGNGLLLVEYTIEKCGKLLKNKNSLICKILKKWSCVLLII